MNKKALRTVVVTVVVLLFTVFGTKQVRAEEVSQDDLYLLANVMYYEVGCFADDEQGEEILKLAGSVVINRVNSPLYPNTIHDVIYQKGQYAKCTLKQFGTRELPQKVYVWAEDLLRNGSIAPANLLYQAQFKQGVVYKEYKGEYFCLSSK